MGAVNKRISTVLVTVVALFAGTAAAAANLDHFCNDLSRTSFLILDECRASESHYKGQVSRLRTWATSDQLAKCERYSWSYRSMAACVQRELGSRGPGVQPWTRPPRQPTDSGIAQPRQQPGRSGSSATAPSPSIPAQRQYIDMQPPGSPSQSRGPVSMGRPTPSSTTFLGAAQAGDIASLEAYLSDGQDIDAPLVDGKTALHHAAMWGREEAVEFLLSRGADHRKADDFGRTPVFYAKDRKYREIEQLLNDAGRR